MRRSVIFDSTLRLVFDGAMVLSVYLLFRGHDHPGGGFVGGLVAGAAVALWFVAGGFDEVARVLPVKAWTLLSAGLVLVTGTALAPLAFGRPVLDQPVGSWDLPGIGPLTVAGATVFDAGVYLVVVGLVAMVFEGLGDDPVDDPADEEKTR